jgi:uncharacterized small protein (DUF1192 family)
MDTQILTIPPPAEIEQRIALYRAEIKALSRLLRMSRAAQEATEAREQREQRESDVCHVG